VKVNFGATIVLACAVVAGDLAAAPQPSPPAHRPADFGFRIEDGYGNCVDSDSGRVTKDMVIGPDTTIALQFTAAEMDTIYRAFVGLDVFDLPEPHPEINLPSDVVTTGDPSTWHRFEIRGRGLQKRFEWSTLNAYFLRNSSDAARMFREEQVVQRLLERRPEYARLPRPRRGYF